jgi:PAS domain S-box-containing protein
MYFVTDNTFRTGPPVVEYALRELEMEKFLPDDEKPRMLVVEDEPEMARLLDKLLRKKFSATVEIAQHTRAALDVLAAGGEFDLITLDYQLPDGDGLSILKEIVSKRDAPPVVMVTGHGDEAVAAEAFRLGASGYVLKDPRVAEVLVDVIDQALTKSRLRKTKQRLQKAEEEYHDLVEAANSIIIKADTDGTITYINRYGLEFFGYAEEELVGKNAVGTIIPEVDSEGRDLAAMLDDLVKHPLSYGANVNENMKKNGERVWVSWSNSELRDENGQVTGNLTVGNNITELKRANEELIKFQYVADSLGEAFLIADLEGSVVYNNAAYEELLGYEKGELLGRRARDFTLTEEFKEEMLLQVDRAYAEGGSWSGEYEAVRKDGSRVPVLASGRVMKDALGKSIGIVGIMSDISRRKKAEDALKHTTDELRRFKLLCDSAIEAICMTDLDAIVLYSNPAFDTLYGYENAEVLGKNLRRLLLPSDVSATALQGLRHSYFETGSFGGEVEVQHEDGSRMTVFASASVMRDDASQPIGIICISRLVPDVDQP